MKLSVIIVAALVLAYELTAQGFDWQPSLRRPYQAPTMFLGLEAGMGLASHRGALPYLEKDIANACCSYENGSSTPIRIGLLAEYWFAPQQAVALQVGLVMQSAEFAAPISTYPRANEAPLVTQYLLNANLTHLTVGAEFRQRVGGTMLVVDAGARANILVSSSMANRETVVGPPDATFTDGSREAVLPTTGLDDAASVVLEPYLSVGYDVPLSFGYYIEPFLRIGTTIGSLSAAHPWRSSDLGLGIRVMRGR
ncbi:MAG: hypothetical protein FGM32_00505 [Candidatus Kapabacteria bacterium]|nr:hypothetical protein [Candidatus Kapabacteria bacterium]